MAQVMAGGGNAEKTKASRIDCNRNRVARSAQTWEEKMRMKVLTLALASTAALLAASNAQAGQVDITNVAVQSYETTDLSGTINGSPFDQSAIGPAA
jgi:hypothetical protein